MVLDIKQYIADEKTKLKQGSSLMLKRPSLLILQRGDNPASNSYIKGKIKDGQEVGVSVDLFKTNGFCQTLDILSYLGKKYDGIILQEPSGFDETERQEILSLITDKQDVDGFKKTSLHTPCTPAAIMDIISYFYKWDLRGKTVVVVGRGELVGKPLVPMLIEEGCTVISCNSKTQPLKDYVQMGDIVITATGVPNLITMDMLKDGAFVIDAGIYVDEKGKLHGDCDPELYTDIANVSVTPVPGGVGLATRLQLMKNVFNAAKV